MSGLVNKVVVITGASSGIGRAAAHRFAQAGAKVVLAGRRSALLEQAAAECRERGAIALAVPTDVTRPEQVEALAQAAIDAFGRIDVWINNAGVLAVGDFWDIPPEDFDQVLRVNLFGYVNGARAVLPHFRRQGRGVLINNASAVAAVGQPRSVPYTVSKWAVRGFSEALRMDLVHQRGIRVCTLMPGAIDTPLFQHAANYSGRQLRAPAPVFPPERVADALVALARRPRPEVGVAAPARLAALAHAVAPGVTGRRLAATAEKALFAAAPTAPTRGNLFGPTGDSDGVTGGWQQRVTSSRGMGRMLAAGALLAVPALVYAWRRSNAAPRRGAPGSYSTRVSASLPRSTSMSRPAATRRVVIEQ